MALSLASNGALMGDDILAIPRKIEQASLAGELDACIKDVCDALNVPYYLFLSSLYLESITLPDIRINTGFPDIMNLSTTRDAALLQDPVIRYCRMMHTPESWELEATGAIKSRHINADKSVFSAILELGVCCGLTIPFHGVSSEFAMFTLCSTEPYADSPLSSPETHYAMNLLGMALFDAHKKAKMSRIQEVNEALTKREKECLLWASEGKTAWEVAAILDVSERTVVFHLQNATKKLGAYSRSGALVKSVLYGII